MTTATPLVTIGQIARETGQPTWLVRRVVDRLNAVSARAGLYRVVDVAKMPAILEALENIDQPSTKKATTGREPVMA